MATTLTLKVLLDGKPADFSVKLHGAYQAEGATEIQKSAPTDYKSSSSVWAAGTTQVIFDGLGADAPSNFLKIIEFDSITPSATQKLMEGDAGIFNINLKSSINPVIYLAGLGGIVLLFLRKKSSPIAAAV